MAKAFDRITKKVLKKIVPKKSEKARLENLASNILELTNKEAEKHNAHAMIAGSLTRDTWLPGKMEFDIFILFPEDVKEAVMEKLGLEIGKRIVKKFKGKCVIEYAQHPYVCGEIKKMHIDIVPCYEIKSTKELKSSVDRTPFHVRYIEKKLPRNLSNDVRLLKQFCSANGIYGADTKTEGFSGYVCELITIRYGGFQKAMKAVSKWKHGEIIDIEKSYKKDEYDSVKKMFKMNSLIIIDPTDKKRNTAAAVSHENFQKLKTLANSFIKTPSEKMFFQSKGKGISASILKKTIKERQTEIIIVKFRSPKIVPDILWPQLRRFASRLESILRENEFSVLRRGVYTNEKDMSIALLEMESCRLPAVMKRIGPSVFDEDGSKNFAKKYEGKKTTINGPFIEDGFWAVETKRPFMTAEDKLKDSLKDSLKVLKAKGIPSHMAKQISKRVEIITDVKKISSLCKKDKEFGIFLKDYFEKESLA